MIGTYLVRGSDLSLWQISHPSTSGIIMSSIMTSGLSTMADTSPVSPLMEVKTS